ncbi:putative oxidoreductase YusZ [Psilocybe cubensis]|uniref:Oxidoreductase YusZ n=1 Tax=Psilocybe cubensis TaxID=181762 RepID=A0ACB8GL64_PSICU|nr:putative oxidoreductase YusZ [Psilocybe cubensis]KAH9476334.1 putative oxidoreductase YusZ [Psilocybe cubensis]
MDSLPSRVWLVTGTSSGFGKHFVLAALARGDRVIAAARSLKKLEAFTSTINAKDLKRLRTLQLDLTDGPEEIERKIGHAFTFWNQIDVLVNNAGSFTGGMMEEGGSKLLRRQFDTNVFGTLDVTTATLPYLRQSKDACVVTIGSRSAWKAELPLLFEATITESFMSELAQFNIKVLLVEPGSFRTEGIQNQVFSVDNPIPIYDDLRKQTKARLQSVGPGGMISGDPRKGVDIIMDVVTNGGVAKGRAWPGYLVLGNDADYDVRKKCEKVLTALDDWSDAVKAVY